MFKFLIGLGAGIIGAIIGGYYGGPQGAYLGFSIGAAIGGFGSTLIAPDEGTVTEGPRINDLHVQTSTYNADMPKIWGKARVAGNVFFAEELKEKRKIRHLDGDAEYWEYNYYGTFAVGLCRPPSTSGIIGIKRLYLDNKLFADFSSDLAIGRDLITSNQRKRVLAVYSGAESQTADSTISAKLGAANTPAYRGCAYVVFDDLKLENYGNRIPNVSAEVIASGSTAETDWIFDHPGGNPVVSCCLDNDKNLISSDVTPGGTEIYIHNGISDTVIKSFSVPYYSDHSGSFKLQGLYVWNGDLYVLYNFWDGPTYNNYLARHNGISAETEWKLELTDFTGKNLMGLSFFNGKMFFNNYSGTQGVYKCTLRASEPSVSVDGFSARTTSGYHQGIALDAAGNCYRSDNTTITRRSGWNGPVTGTESGFSSQIDGIYYDRDNDLIVACQLNAKRIAVYDGFSSTYKTLTKVTSTAANVEDIVSDICDDVGITASMRDTSDLTGLTIDGYVHTKTMSAQKAIEPLMTAYNFDIAEIDHKLHFVGRGGANQATIPDTELRARPYGNKSHHELLISRVQESELPKELTVSYIDAGRDYQESSGRSLRLNTDAVGAAKVELPMVIDNDTGKRIAEILHNTMFTERTQYAFTTSIKYLYLAPTDVITVDGHKMHIEAMSIQGNLLQISGPAEVDENYISNATTDDPAFSDQNIKYFGPTAYVFLDIPVFLGTHDNAGFYVAVHGYTTGWVGAEIHTSPDGGATFSPTMSVMDDLEIGFTTDVLATGDQYKFDRINTVNVQLNYDSHSLSATAEINVLNGTNWAAIGVHGRWEIIGFAGVTGEVDGTYTLDTLLRGLKGTDHAMGSHAANDVFVMLDTDKLGRITQGTDVIDVQTSYKIVTVHGDTQAAPVYDFTNSAVGLEPYSPVQVAGTRDGSNNLTITWIRRARVDNEWEDGGDVPVGEAAESYEVDAYDNGNVVRTIEVTSETASYTAAQQTTDGLTPGDPVHVKIYQISADVGRGYAVDATI